MLRIKRLKIIRYRNVEPCELTFSDGFNVLLGKNASGKTSLLRLLAMIVQDHFEDLDRHAALEWDFEGPLGRATLSIVPVDDRPGVQGVLLDTQQMRRLTFDGWRIHSEVETDDTRSGPLIRALMGMKPQDFNRVLESRSLPGGPGRFDEALDAFERVARSRPDAEAAMSVKLGSDASVVHKSGPFLESLERQVVYPFPERLSADDEQDPILAAVRDAFGASRVRAESARVRSGEERGTEPAYAAYATPEFHFQAGGEWTSHHTCSFGQKRYLAFLVHFAGCAHTPFIADELTNGFHLDWIKSAIERMRGHQCFLASQNPLLVDWLTGFQSAAQTRDTFLTCRIATTDTGARVLRWANLTENEGETFYRLYQTGIGNTSEALRDAGLW